MSQYKMDVVRFLRGRAKAARLMKNYADEENFKACADRVKELEEVLLRLVYADRYTWEKDGTDIFDAFRVIAKEVLFEGEDDPKPGDNGYGVVTEHDLD